MQRGDVTEFRLHGGEFVDARRRSAEEKRVCIDAEMRGPSRRCTAAVSMAATH
jgi:hypothetical protein